jgi:3-deoxy-manno-octulosonate cytidylyltransferase (CMP-KDO synthetase)
MTILGVIPARYASTRFPGKPLVDIQGKPMIQRVYENVINCNIFTEVVVATDDIRIEKVVKGFGAKVVLTSTEHQSGTDRCGEVIKNLHNKFDIVVNIQGDEPMVNPLQLKELIDIFKNPQAQIATLKSLIKNDEDITNPNVVKVVTSLGGKALYFSRSTIPFNRNNSTVSYFKHIGLYAYTMDALKKIIQLPIGNLEKIESLEQLRWLENGYNVYVAESNFNNIGIDTPEDLIELNKNFKF